MKEEVEMEEAPEAEEMEGGIKDKRLSDSNPSESKQSKITDAQVAKPSRGGGRDYFAGGQSAW